MADEFRPQTRTTALVGRHYERVVLNNLVAAIRIGGSRTLVVRGDPGVGKTVLLDLLANGASGCRVARAAGVESEMELAFAGLHQLCAPILQYTDRLPEPQRSALMTAFGISSGPTPDRFLLGLAVLGLLSEAAGERPLLCIVDDQQWLDRASAQALGFVARRLAADPVGLVLATRVSDPNLVGLPELELDGLRNGDAQAVLESALAAPLDPRVRDLIIAETRGNPLALLELPRAVAPADLAGGYGLLGSAAVSTRIEDNFRRQLDALPAQARQLLQLAAADTSGDPVLLRRAAGLLHIPLFAAAPAVEAGLVVFGVQVQFRHPLVRSAAYRSASPEVRQELHHALADATDSAIDPDRRAWHRAHAATGPDEDVATELERSAGRAQARGGLATAAAFLERSVQLTADPARHVGRILAAAQANTQAGVYEHALELLGSAQAQPLDELTRAQVDLLRGHVAFASGMSRDAPALLLAAARRMQPFDLDTARETYLVAMLAASFAGRSAVMVEIAHAAKQVPPADPIRPIDLLLDGLALVYTGDPAAAAPLLRQVVTATTAGDTAREEGLRWAWVAASLLWDDDAADAIIKRQVQLARQAGALDQLPIDLLVLANSAAWSGDLTVGAELVAETSALCEVTGSRVVPYSAMYLAALRGDEAELLPLMQVAAVEGEAIGQGTAGQYASWAAAILYNGFGRYQRAAASAAHASEDPLMHHAMWALPELVEAAARAGDLRTAGDAVERLAQTTGPGGTDTGLGIEARSRALVHAGGTAEGLYREAIDRLGRTRRRPDLARAQLLYGEWLRRENRRHDARTQLRAAHDLLTRIGMNAFAERARRELLATGETPRKRTVETPVLLTAQETLIARLAADGQTNPEIGAQLFLSARTVEWHLGKIFGKLGITSRRELGGMLFSRA